MIVRVINRETSNVVYEENDESDLSVPDREDRIRVPDNGDEFFIVKERHYDYDATPTELTLYCLQEFR